MCKQGKAGQQNYMTIHFVWMPILQQCPTSMQEHSAVLPAAHPLSHTPVALPVTTMATKVLHTQCWHPAQHAAMRSTPLKGRYVCPPTTASSTSTAMCVNARSQGDEQRFWHAQRNTLTRFLMHVQGPTENTHPTACDMMRHSVHAQQLNMQHVPA